MRAGRGAAAARPRSRRTSGRPSAARAHAERADDVGRRSAAARRRARAITPARESSGRARPTRRSRRRRAARRSPRRAGEPSPRAIRRPRSASNSAVATRFVDLVLARARAGRCSRGGVPSSVPARAISSRRSSSRSRRCMMPTDVSLSASSSTFCFASSSVRSATRCSRPSRSRAACPVIVLNATGELADLVVRGHRRLAVEVAGGDGLGRLGDREDRPRDPARGEVCPEREQARDHEADAAERERERRAGAKAARWSCSATSAGPDLVEPAVDADHRHARVVG